MESHHHFYLLRELWRVRERIGFYTSPVRDVREEENQNGKQLKAKRVTMLFSLCKSLDTFPMEV